MLFLVWYDDSSKTAVADKIQAAIAAYVVRFQTRPSLVLVNAVDHMERADVLVRSERTVQPNSFWVGLDEANLPTV
jgi:hypothetical protein